MRNAGAEHIGGIVGEIFEEISPMTRIHDVVLDIPVIVVGGQAMEGTEKHAVLIPGNFLRKITARALVSRPVTTAVGECRTGKPCCFSMAQPGFIIIEKNIMIRGNLGTQLTQP